jgi:microcystin-dependent protein
MPVNGKSRRSYTGSAVPNTLGSQLEENATTISLPTAMVGWANDGVPFFVVVEPGTAKEEKICVKYNTSTSLIVVDPADTSVWAEDVLGRGVDNTSDQVHKAGSVIYPVFTSIEANQANELVSKYANAGSVVYQGSGTPGTFTELAIGTASHVLRVNSGVPQWGQITADGIGTGAVTSEKILDGTIVLGDLAAALVTYLVPVGTINAYAGATAPNGWLLCNGTSTTGYTALADLVGATTPDLRGHTLVGKSSSAPFDGVLLSKFGSTTSTAAHTHDLGSHTHDFPHQHGGTTGVNNVDHTHNYTQTGQNAALVVNASDTTADVVNQPLGSATTGQSTTHTHAFTTNINYPTSTLTEGPSTNTSGASSASATHGNVQPSALVNFIIKY